MLLVYAGILDRTELFVHARGEIIEALEEFQIPQQIKPKQLWITPIALYSSRHRLFNFLYISCHCSLLPFLHFTIAALTFLDNMLFASILSLVFSFRIYSKIICFGTLKLNSITFLLTTKTLWIFFFRSIALKDFACYIGLEFSTTSYFPISKS